jgi:hypothetical protein
MPFDRSELIIRRRPSSEPPKREPLKIKVKPKAPEGPKPLERTPLNIKVKPRAPEGPKPPEAPRPAPAPARLGVSPDMRRRMDELKKRVLEKNPDLAHPPGTVPERKPLNIKAKPRNEPPGRSPLNINIRPKSAFEWVQAA